MSLQIVCVADKEPTAPYLVRGFAPFKASCVRYGFEPIILGWGQEWRGLGSKPKLLKKAIEDGTITADKIIFADAFDVVFANNPCFIEELWKVYYSSAKIVFNAERSCFPDASLADKHPDTPYPFKYLNSGLSIGYTSAYLECLTEMEVDSWPDDHKQADGTYYHRNDQDDWMQRFLFGQCGNQCKIVLDSKCELFQTLTDCTFNDFEISDVVIRNLITGKVPLAYHANGGAKTGDLWEPILQQLKL